MKHLLEYYAFVNEAILTRHFDEQFDLRIPSLVVKDQEFQNTDLIQRVQNTNEIFEE